MTSRQQQRWLGRVDQPEIEVGYDSGVVEPKITKRE